MSALTEIPGLRPYVRQCPRCQSWDHTLAGHVDGRTAWSCDRCGHVYGDA